VPLRALSGSCALRKHRTRPPLLAQSVPAGMNATKPFGHVPGTISNRFSRKAAAALYILFGICQVLITSFSDFPLARCGQRSG
jgi:hypothetical protein